MKWVQAGMACALLLALSLGEARAWVCGIAQLGCIDRPREEARAKRTVRPEQLDQLREQRRKREQPPGGADQTKDPAEGGAK